MSQSSSFAFQPTAPVQQRTALVLGRDALTPQLDGRVGAGAERIGEELHTLVVNSRYSVLSSK